MRKWVWFLIVLCTGYTLAIISNVYFFSSDWILETLIVIIYLTLFFYGMRKKLREHQTRMFKHKWVRMLEEQKGADQ